MKGKTALVMSMKGKILLATNRNTASSVNIDKRPTERGYYTGQSESIPAGTAVLCVGSGGGWAIHVIRGELTWEVDSREYIVAEMSEKLSGKSFCFTGALSNTREFYKALVELHGGTFSSSVTKNLTYLVMADPRSHSTKAEKARSYGTTCIGEKELLKMLYGS
jgi:NAD-dependent DNA ligase